MCEVIIRTNWVNCKFYDRLDIMKLSEWLKKEGLTHDDFLVYLQNNDAIVSKGAIDKWCNGQRIPRKDDMRKICTVTNGEVSANDFYDM